MSLHRTTDLNFAAFLIVSGYAIKAAERDGKRAQFIFEIEADELQKLQMAWVGGGQVAARSYAETLRSLKSIIHQE